MQCPAAAETDAGSQGRSQVPSVVGGSGVGMHPERPAAGRVTPETVSAWMKGRAGAAPGDCSTRCRPSGSVMVTVRKSGLARARFATPGVTGNSPSAAQTYHEESAPRSSFPGSSTGASAYSHVHDGAHEALGLVGCSE